MAVQTYVKEASVNPLEVIKHYNTLMQESAGADSLYIRTKETLDAFLAKSTIPMNERANILSQALVQMTTSITAQAMTTAVAIAREDRVGVYELTKLREDTLLVQAQRDKLNRDEQDDHDLKAAQIQDMVIKGWKIQSDMRSENGTTVVGLTTTANAILPANAFQSQGIKYEQEQQIKASVYATFAKSYRESGVISWTLDGVTGKVTAMTDLDNTNPGLTKAQENVAIRQEKAFDDNMVQHSANSSANMIGLLLSAEQAGVLTAADADRWRTALTYLNTPTI